MRGLKLHLHRLQVQVDQHLHLGAQDERVDGLEHHVDGPRRIGLEQVRFVAEHRRQEDDGDMAGLAALADEAGGLVAVHAGHVQVQQDDREFLLQQPLEGLVARAGQDDLVPQLLQRADRGEQVPFVVVDDQHPRAQGASFRADGREGAGGRRETRTEPFRTHSLSSPAASGSRCCPRPVSPSRPGGSRP